MVAVAGEKFNKNRIPTHKHCACPAPVCAVDGERDTREDCQGHGEDAVQQEGGPHHHARSQVVSHKRLPGHGHKDRIPYITTESTRSARCAIEGRTRKTDRVVKDNVRKELAKEVHACK